MTWLAQGLNLVVCGDGGGIKQLPGQAWNLDKKTGDKKKACQYNTSSVRERFISWLCSLATAVSLQPSDDKEPHRYKYSWVSEQTLPLPTMDLDAYVNHFYLFSDNENRKEIPIQSGANVLDPAFDFIPSLGVLCGGASQGCGNHSSSYWDTLYHRASPLLDLNEQEHTVVTAARW